jgi:hypothetical protein
MDDKEKRVVILLVNLITFISVHNANTCACIHMHTYMYPYTQICNYIIVNAN